MRGILLPTLYTLSGVSLYAALHHGLVAVRRPVERVHLLFALVSLAGAGYMLAKTGAYQAATPQELVEARRWELTAAFAFFSVFPWFVAQYTGMHSRWLLMGLAVFWAALFAVNHVLPYGIHFLDMPRLTYFSLPWGENVLDFRARHRSPWHNLAWLGVFVVMGYSIHACMAQHRRGQKSQARTLALALSLFFGFVLSNVAVNRGYVQFIHTAEFGFVALIMVMSQGLTRELRDHERRMQAVLSHLPAVVYIKDLEGRYLLINHLGETLFQLTNAHAIGKTDFDLFPREQAETFRANDLAVLASRQATEFEEMLKWNNQPHIFRSLKFPLLDQDGMPYAICGISTDITDSRRNDEEMRLLRRQIWHADRVTRTGAITASLAHEISQPLAAILSNAQAGLRFLDRANPNLDELKALLHDIIRDEKRAGAVINGLRAMLQQQETPREHIDLGQSTEEVLELLHSELITRGVEVGLKLDKGCTLSADKAQIQQVILNLIMNALEAMAMHPAGGRHLQVSVSRESQHQARVSIRDNGIGIPPEILDKVFDGFFTTKAQGLGVGLAVCRSIVESHSGKIWVENNDDQGVTFHVELPIDPTIRMPPPAAKQRTRKLRPASA